MSYLHPDWTSKLIIPIPSKQIFPIKVVTSLRHSDSPLPHPLCHAYAGVTLSPPSLSLTRDSDNQQDTQRQREGTHSHAEQQVSEFSLAFERESQAMLRTRRRALSIGLFGWCAGRIWIRTVPTICSICGLTIARPPKTRSAKFQLQRSGQGNCYERGWVSTLPPTHFIIYLFLFYSLICLSIYQCIYSWID